MNKFGYTPSEGPNGTNRYRSGPLFLQIAPQSLSIISRLITIVKHQVKFEDSSIQMKVTIIKVIHLLTLFAVTHSTDILRNLNHHAVKKVSKSSTSMKGVGKGKGIASTESSDLHFMMDSMSLDLSLSMGLSTEKSGKKVGHSSKASKGSKASKSDKKSSKKGSYLGNEDTAETPASSPNGSDDGEYRNQMTDDGIWLLNLF